MFTIGEQVNGGAHGTIFRGKDSLDRPVAVKFIGTSIGDDKFIREQAQALARVQCKEVIHVIAIEKLTNPTTHSESLAIVMEWLDGVTLEEWLSTGVKDIQEIRRVGFGILRGVQAIHDASLVHQDLHAGNIMVGSDWVKIIDILYQGALAAVPETQRLVRQQQDRNRLRRLLSDVVDAFDLESAAIFGRGLSQESSLSDIQGAFDRATTPKIPVDVAGSVAKILSRVNDTAYVEGEDYALALNEQIANPVVPSLIEAMIVKGCVKSVHTPLLRILWDRLTAEEKLHVCASLSSAIDREIPTGDYGPPLYTLRAFGAEGWNLLQKATVLRLEKAIVQSISEGSFEARTGSLSNGGLGTFVKSLYPHFNNKKEVLAKIVRKLHGQWLSQNYIGHCLMSFLPRVAETVSEKDELIVGIRQALSDNAWTVRAGLKELPEEWQTACLHSDEE